MKRRDFLGRAGGLGVASVAGGFSMPALLLGGKPAHALGDDIPVGLLFSLTGAVAVVEHTLHDAALLAMEEINASGGIHGR